jgi:hypothetical protein
MTTYIPSLTLPNFIFEQPAVAILLPVVAGAAIGYSTRRETPHDIAYAVVENQLKV